ncbi:hypothetical protein HNQ93_000041 [Hymenobacter luteus]|uniref:Uncharacterized protein n=2 Tax=Hymenobacter TaxID=89966 RepID=A0A7W9SWL9_9BACT|nr:MULTISPECIES: hypothetical protein [Hymenobacter]MBB4600479.1 hypothetical protein [Hymenobacter latericoloratus]MBB6057211.1 hypothetical protein [Hymenobacter luteus]
MANPTQNPQPRQQDNAAASGAQPTQPATTQEELAQDDGAGIRGGYGNSDQTNGLEGGGQTTSDRSDPQQSAQE